MKQHGDTVAGKKIEIIRKDTGGPNPDVAKRLAQELVVRDNVDILAGFTLTPEALGAAGVSAEAKKFMVVMNAATSIITEKSPYIVRVSLTLPQISETLGTWAVKKGGVKKAYTMVSDYGPGIDAEGAFQNGLQGGRRRDRRLGAHAGRQSGLLGLRAARQGPQSGIDLRVRAGRRAAGGASARLSPNAAWTRRRSRSCRHRRSRSTRTRSRRWATSRSAVISAWHYDYNHKSKMNADFVKAFNAEFKRNPDFFAVGGYDGMHLIYEALKKTGGKTDGDSLIAAAKGMKWESPRGPISIDPETRDIVQNVYIRKVEEGRRQPSSMSTSTRSRTSRTRRTNRRVRSDVQTTSGWGDRHGRPIRVFNACHVTCYRAR